MLSKSLILVLLGCALALANPIQKNENPVSQQANNVDIGSWLQDAHQGIKQAFKQTIQPFEQIYYSLVGVGNNGQEYSKEKIEQLRNAFHEITDQAREQLNDIEVVILTNTIGHLQNAVEECARSSGAGVQHEVQVNQNIQAGHPSVQQGNLQEIINPKTNTATDKINQLPNSLWSGINGVGQQVQGMFNGQMQNLKGNSDGGFTLGTGIFSKLRDGEEQNTVGDNVNRAKQNLQNQFNQFMSSGVQITDKVGGGAHSNINGGVENVKENIYKTQDTVNGFFNADKPADFFSHLGSKVGSGIQNVQDNVNEWGSKALNLGGGLFNKFGDDAQKVFHEGKKNVDNGIENVKGQLSQWGSGLVENANKFGNQAQGALNNGIHGVHNQQVQSTNNHGQNVYQGNTYNSRLTLDTVAKQLAGAVAVQMQNLQQNLLQWKTVVAHVLSNRKSRMEHQAQAVHEGLGTIEDRIGLPELGWNQEKPNVQGQAELGWNQGKPNVQGQAELGWNQGKHNVQGSFKLLPNHPEKLPSINLEVGSVGYMPPMDEGAELDSKLEIIMPNLKGSLSQKILNADEGSLIQQKSNPGEGGWTKLGKKVGGDFGKGVDNISNFFGNMFGK